MNTITEEVKKIDDYINKTWKKFSTETEVKLSRLFPKPANSGLNHIWKYGAADLVIRFKSRIIAIIEPGGAHHFEEKQMRNDRRKWKLCEINGVRCLRMMNGVFDRLSNRKRRCLLGKFLFGVKKK